MTATEFLEFGVYLQTLEKEKLEKHEKWEWYQAQIAAEIRRSRAKYPDQVKTKEFLVTYQIKKEQTPQERAANSQSSWLALAGITPKEISNAKP